MKYHSSEHFRKDPIEEVNAALEAGNTVDSVIQTLGRRLITEEGITPPNDYEIGRILEQLAHLGSLMIQESAA